MTKIKKDGKNGGENERKYNKDGKKTEIIYENKVVRITTGIMIMT